MRIVTSVILTAAVAAVGVALAQTDHTAGMTKNANSPASQASAMVNGKEVYILYHAPSVKGRHIFGGADALQPDDSVWRAGADTATLLHTDADLTIGKLTVPAGEYSLYVFLDKGKWELIVNKQTKQWGINRDGSTTDVSGAGTGPYADDDEQAFGSGREGDLRFVRRQAGAFVGKCDRFGSLQGQVVSSLSKP